MFIILVLYNPLQNGDFEQWSYINSTIPFAWDTVTGSGSSCEWTPATISRSGNYSIRIRVVNDAGGYDCAIAQSKVVSENTDYTVRFWVLDTSQTAYAKVYVRCYRSDGSFISGSFAGDSSINIPSWQVVGGIYTTPSECYYMDAQLRVYDTGTVYVDVGNLSLYHAGARGEFRLLPALWMDRGGSRYGWFRYQDRFPAQENLRMPLRRWWR